MIRKLKLKFVLLSMVTLFVLLSVIIVGMNIINSKSVVEKADATLKYLSQNKGTFPEFNQKPNEGNIEMDMQSEFNRPSNKPSDKPSNKPNDEAPPHMSPETPYESRFFSVLLDANGETVNIDTSKISSVDDESAQNYARVVISSNKGNGFLREFRYAVKSDAGGTLVTFLDCSRALDAFYGFLRTSIFMSLVGLVIAFFAIFFLSDRIINPIAQSYAKQKQFITDAGHEIKTPLTIINANVDILEMELGEGNESLVDIKGQTMRLRGLTDDLVMLARMEEPENKMKKTDFPMSEVVADAAHPFNALAQTQGKVLKCDIQPLLSACGNARAISQLVSILLDNALKYSPLNSEIELCLAKQGHSVVLTVLNKTEYDILPERLGQIFDRFYRADASRNSEMGGHGIGLSVAKAIVNAHGGRIYAALPDAKTFEITVVLPRS